MLNGNRNFGKENNRLKQKNDKEGKEILRNENEDCKHENDRCEERIDKNINLILTHQEENLLVRKLVFVIEHGVEQDIIPCLILVKLETSKVTLHILIKRTQNGILI